MFPDKSLPDAEPSPWQRSQRSFSYRNGVLPKQLTSMGRPVTARAHG